VISLLKRTGLHCAGILKADNSIINRLIVLIWVGLLLILKLHKNRNDKMHGISRT